MEEARHRVRQTRGSREGVAVAIQPICHPDRKHKGLGLCGRCYNLRWKRLHLEHVRARNRRWYHRHKDTARLTARRWKRDNAERHREYQRDRRFRRHGLTRADYKRLLAAQGGCCAVCGSDKPGGGCQYFAIDHEHEIDEVRGLLCMRCNPLLGRFHRDVKVLKKAVAYLERAAA